MLKRLLVVVALATTGCATAQPAEFSLSHLITAVSTHVDDGDMPSTVPPQTKGHPEAFNALLWVAVKHHIPVTLVIGLAQERNLWGATSTTNHIYLESALTVDGEAVVLAHELSHVFTPMLSAPDDDVVAQAVSFIVTGHYGIDATDTSLGYYFWLLGGDFDKVRTSLMQNEKDIQRVADFILHEAADAPKE